MPQGYTASSCPIPSISLESSFDTHAPMLQAGPAWAVYLGSQSRQRDFGFGSEGVVGKGPDFRSALRRQHCPERTSHCGQPLLVASGSDRQRKIPEVGSAVAEQRQLSASNLGQLSKQHRQGCGICSVQFTQNLQRNRAIRILLKRCKSCRHVATRLNAEGRHCAPPLNRRSTTPKRPTSPTKRPLRRASQPRRAPQRSRSGDLTMCFN